MTDPEPRVYCSGCEEAYSRSLDETGWWIEHTSDGGECEQKKQARREASLALEETSLGRKLDRVVGEIDWLITERQHGSGDGITEAQTSLKAALRELIRG